MFLGCSRIRICGRSACNWARISREPSVDPSSTQINSISSGTASTRSTTCRSVARSLYTGMTTESFILLHRSVVEDCGNSKIQLLFPAQTKLRPARVSRRAVNHGVTTRKNFGGQVLVRQVLDRLCSITKAALDTTSQSLRFSLHGILIVKASAHASTGRADSHSEQKAPRRVENIPRPQFDSVVGCNPAAARNPA